LAVIGDFAIHLRGSRKHLAGDYCVMWDIINCVRSRPYEQENENDMCAACNMCGAEAKFIQNLAGKSDGRQIGTSMRRRKIPKMELRRNRVGGDGL
jgi:hypothetical protein